MNKQYIKKYSAVCMLVFLSLAALILNACGQESSVTQLSGSVVMGPVEGATVQVYGLSADGSSGQVLATARTGSDGTFTVQGSFSGPLRFVVSGGSYSDEATGQQVQIQEGQDLETWVGDSESCAHVGVNAFTTIAAKYAYQYAHQYAHQNGNTHQWLKQSIEQIHAQVASSFGLEGVDIVETQPDDLTNPNGQMVANSNEAKLGAALAGFTQIACDAGMSPDEVPVMLQNMAQDYSDGEFNGEDCDGNAVQSGTDVTPVQAMNSFENSLQNFLNGDKNESGIEANQMEFQFQNNR